MSYLRYGDILIVIQFGVSPLISAALEGHESLVKLLLEAKADVNHPDNVSPFCVTLNMRP